MTERTVTFAADLDSAAPDLVQLLPAGRITAHDGRVFVLDDPQGVIDASMASGLDLPIDYEHQNDDPARQKNGAVPAAGWIKELIAKEDGIWARVEWTETARGHIAKREYRYLSPSMLVEQGTNRVTRIKGAGLVHTPALTMKALASREDEGAMAKFAQWLGLDPAAPVPEILRALEGRAAPAQAAVPPVPLEAVQELLTERNALASQLRRLEATRTVEEALASGHITPAMRGWAMALCEADPEGFNALLGSSEPAFGHLFKPVAFPRDERKSTASPGVASEVARQLGIDPARLR